MWRDGTNISPSGGRIGSRRHRRPSCPLAPRFLHRFLRTLLLPPRPRRRYPHRSRYLCPVRHSYRDPCYLRRGSPLLLHRYRYLHRSRYLCTILRSYRGPCYLRRGSLRALRSHSLPSDRSRARIRLRSP